jgi:hypothetical protein
VLTSALRGAAFAGGTVTNGAPESASFEDYRFCNGRTEYRLLWTNAGSQRLTIEVPPGTTQVTDELGRPRPIVGGRLAVGFEPALVRRTLDYDCGRAGTATSTPPVVADFITYPYQGKVHQVAYANGPRGGAGQVWSRLSVDAAGTQWPPTWNRVGYAQAWGPAPVGAPPTDRIDSVTIGQLPAQTRWRQEVYAGGTVWWRDSRDAGGLQWGGAWAHRTLAATWGADANHPPVGRVDTVTTYSGPVPGVWRQTVIAGGNGWYRETSVVARDGTPAWPAAWRGPLSATAVWGGHVNHPPTDRVDAYSLVPVKASTGATIRWRQVIVHGETVWTRDSNDAGGSSWPPSWNSRTLAASWGANTTTADRPPVYARR